MLSRRICKKILSLAVSLSIAVAIFHWSGKTVPASAAAQTDQQAQIEKGKAALGRACVACHANILSMVQFQRKTADKWRDTVYSMIGRGGHILTDEIEPITAYLTASFGPNSPPPSPSSRTPDGNQPAPAGLAQQLPEGAAKAVLVQNCQQCHDLQVVVSKTASPDQWKEIIARMVTLGARVTPPEQEQLVQYLTGLAVSRERR
jgi:mono/diheme cytochrome c family protein